MSWRRFLSRAARDRERAEEFQTHLDFHIHEYMARGLTPEEATRRARLAFGNPRVKREEVDGLNRLPFLDALGRDLRYALRMLRRSPAFTATAVVTLALVIGGNTAVASLADALLLRPLPYPQADRLAQVVTSFRAPQHEGIYESENGASWEALRDQATAVDVALYAGELGGAVNAVIDQVATTVHQSRVSAGYFRVLGVGPLIGREFTPDEDRPGGPAVALISYPFWQRHLHGDPTVAGKAILLRGEAHTVVGVMPEMFRNPSGPVDVWTPARPSRKGEGGGANYGVIARVKNGHTWAQANAELSALGRVHFKSDAPPGVDVWWSLVPMQDVLVEETRPPIEMLAGAMITVLVIACVNIAALLLARGRTRAREIATRMALGSGRGAVVRQLMVEHLALAVMGGTAGAIPLMEPRDLRSADACVHGRSLGGDEPPLRGHSGAPDEPTGCEYRAGDGHLASGGRRPRPLDAADPRRGPSGARRRAPGGDRLARPDVRQPPSPRARIRSFARDDGDRVAAGRAVQNFGARESIVRRQLVHVAAHARGHVGGGVLGAAAPAAPQRQLSTRRRGGRAAVSGKCDLRDAALLRDAADSDPPRP